MMKKVLFVVLSLLIAAAAFADQSDPSNEVGYVKVTASATGQYHVIGVQASAPFGLTFKFWDVWPTAIPGPGAGVPTYGTESTKPSDIVGSQAVPWTPSVFAEKIVRQADGATASRRAADGMWTGSLESGSTMIAGHAYWFVTLEGTARSIILGGEVDNSGSYPARTISAPAAGPPFPSSTTPYSWRESRNVARTDLNLLEDGFLGGSNSLNADRVVEQGTGAGFHYLSTGAGGWTGTLAAINPGRAYWILNRHVGNTWTYDYDGGPAAAASIEVERQLPTISTVKAPDLTGREIQSVKSPVSKPAASSTTDSKSNGKKAETSAR
jgi:hypothetical protein